jgi:putative transposase
MKVSRSGYYEWLTNSGCNRDKEDYELTCRIKVIFQEGRGNYGSRSIKKALLRQDIIISRKRIGSLIVCVEKIKIV